MANQEQPSNRFRLRKAQLEAMAAAAEGVFAERLVGILKESGAPGVVGTPDDVLRARVEKGLKRGRRHGLKLENSLGSFVALMFHISPQFDEHPNLRRALTEGEGTADQRMVEIQTRTKTEDWRQAKEKAGKDAWEKLT